MLEGCGVMTASLGGGGANEAEAAEAVEVEGGAAEEAETAADEANWEREGGVVPALRGARRGRAEARRGPWRWW